VNSHSEVSLRAGGHDTLHVVLRTVNHGSGHAWTRCRDERRVRAACTAAPTHPRLWYVGAYAACTATTADPCADLRLSFCLRARGARLRQFPSYSYQSSAVTRVHGGFAIAPPLFEIGDDVVSLVF
jgi:hypothetical protein